MPYDESQIETLWLGDSKVNVSLSQLVEAFGVAEKYLGVDWIESHRIEGNVIHTGALATLPVVSTGIKLRALQKAVGFPELVARLRSGDPAAYSELSAAFLCTRSKDAIVEFGVPVLVGDRTRRPDFRVRFTGGTWTYVEVTAPNSSDATVRAQQLIEAIAAELMFLPDGTSIEVLLLKKPNSYELKSLVQEVIALAGTSQVQTKECEDLAIVTVNRLPPCVIEPLNYGREVGPVVGTAKGIVENGVPKKSVSVRTPVVDQRAEGFLTTEARQLPTNESGLIFIDMTSVVGDFAEWETLLRRRLQPSMHTRVSGVCLARWGTRSTPSNETAVIPEVKLIGNTNAAIEMPGWLRDQLGAASGIAVGNDG